MTAELAALATAALLVAQTDTTVVVKPGARLEVSNWAGQIDVQGWAKNVVRVAASHREGDAIYIWNTDSLVVVKARTRRPMPAAIEYRISVPSWMPLQLSGMSSDINVVGVKAPITVGTVRGAVHVRGGEGDIQLNSVEGSVNLESAEGRVQLSSVNEGVNVNNIRGDLRAETLNGNIEIAEAYIKKLVATTVNGEINYDGPLQHQGEYLFATHNGDIMVGVPEGTDAEVAVATFGGEFESSFPVMLTETRRGKKFHFTMGSGGARLDLRTFQGTIQLRRLAGKTAAKAKE